MHRPFYQSPRGYYDRDSGGGSGYQQPDFTSDSWTSPSPYTNPGLRPHRPRPPPTFHRNYNQYPNQQSPGGYNGRGHRFPIMSRGQPQRSRGGPPFRGRGSYSTPQTSGWGGPRFQQPYAPRQQWSNGPPQHNELQQRQDNPAHPWMTPDIMAMIKERNELMEIYGREKTEESHRMFKVKRIQVNMACNDARILYQRKHPHEPHAAYTPYPRFSKPTFYCDACDRKVLSQAALDEHNAEHITCKLDGCTYTAHAKLVMKHIELQHSNDLFHRIKGYNTPEEIEVWKEERRMNFPTPENILRKRTERAERIARGETMGGNKNEDEDEEMLFRYKIIPEKRTRSSFRQAGPEYQSDGEEEIQAKKPKSGKMSQSYQSVFSTYNTSPIVKLMNFYTDIEVNEFGQLIGSTRETWTPQNDEDTELMIFKRNEDDDKQVEFNITDDEEDECTSSRSVDEKLQLDKIKIAVSDLPADSIPAHNGTTSSTSSSTSLTKLPASKPESQSTTNQPPIGLLGLLNYGSDWDSDEEHEDGEVDSETEKTNDLKDGDQSTSISKNGPIEDKVSAIERQKSSSYSDDEAPDELASTSSKSFSVDTSICHQNDLQPLDPVETEHSKVSRKKKQKTKPMKVKSENDAELDMCIPVRKRYTLLQRLLAPDIRHERNLILQACRYIVDKNFFEKASESSTNTEETHDTITET